MKLRKNLLFLLIAILVVGGGAYIIYGNQEETKRQTEIIAGGKTAIPVNIVLADYQSIPNEYSSNGTLAPLQEMMLSSEMAGTITRVLVKEGDYVRAGQTVATIKKDVLEVDHSNAQANYQNAVTTNQRYENAFKTGGITKQQLDQSRLQLQNAKNMLRQANIRVGDSNVKTMISGIINQRSVEPGAVVAPGTPLFQIVNVAKLKLQVTVNESRVATLKLGDPVKVTMSVYPDKVFYGKVTFIAPLGDAALNFPVEVTIENNPTHDLKAGMYGTATFGDHTEHSYLIVPKEAFVDGISNQQVFVVQKDQTVKLTKVVTGQIFGDKVQIISGLQPGTTVVTSGQINLANGSKISVIK